MCGLFLRPVLVSGVRVQRQGSEDGDFECLFSRGLRYEGAFGAGGAALVPAASRAQPPKLMKVRLTEPSLLEVVKWKRLLIETPPFLCVCAPPFALIL